MFAGSVMDVELRASDQLQRVVELLWLGGVGDVAGVDHERRVARHRDDLVDRHLEGRARVRIGGLGEADMAVGHLDEGEARVRRLRRANQTRRRHAAGHRPDDAGPGPQHALQGLAAVVSPAFVIVGHHFSPCAGEARRSGRRLGGVGGSYSAVMRKIARARRGQRVASGPIPFRLINIAGGELTARHSSRQVIAEMRASRSVSTALICSSSSSSRSSSRAI